jgi:hypothetical protein
MDVQGAERDVVQGGKQTLRKTKYVSVEYGATTSYPEAMNREETIQLFEEHDFKLVPEHSDEKKCGDLLFINNNI